MFPEKRPELQYQDILRDRRKTSDLLWASRHCNPACAYNLPHKSSPDDIKSAVLTSYQLKEVIQELSENENIPQKELHKAVIKFLKEIGYKRVEPVLRWLSFFTSKMMKKSFNGIMVNEKKFFEIKSKYGRNPVLLVPSHRSYGDFILMSYICFNYDVDIPRIAAGTDFHSMALMGTILRDCCAFFMRRSFTSDKLYSATFNQYVGSLITNGDSSVEFFIEGTRSRTAKSLMPKYGFLSMALKPFFYGLVPDITIVPVSYSYDRVFEEFLFAYENLGVPKPKESLRGFWNSLRVLKENWGYAHITFGEPFSVKEFFGYRLDRSIHNFGPVELQQLTSQESREIVRLAHSIIRKQQFSTLITCFNLIATIINHRVKESSAPLGLTELVSEIEWLLPIMEGLGATVIIKNNLVDLVTTDLKLHESLVNVTCDGKIKLIRKHSNTQIDKTVVKGHCLSNRTIDTALPLLMIQYYSNPCAHFLVNLVFVVLIVQSEKTGPMSQDALFSEFQFLRSIFSHEFILNKETEEMDFAAAFEFSKNQKAVVQSGSDVNLGENVKLRQFCSSFFKSYIPGYLVIIDVLLKEPASVEKNIMKAYQEAVESLMNKRTGIPPATLSLDLAKNALQALVAMGAVAKRKRENATYFEIHPKELEAIKNRLRNFDVVSNLDVENSEHFANFVAGKL